ncbi:MAG: ATP-binding cassette domain-containing protein [Bacteroidales bacterium]|nr:ATP-binding cassette domain-containing protein [Bacteroidales bacterium]MBN2817810.1 ATP-binding cassette domain-containing protein [Bacteroidales bacterium]
MSEEILKALMQLFAIIAKQDEGVEKTQVEYVKNFLQQQIAADKVSEYFGLFEENAGLRGDDSEEKKKNKLTSVKDSVRILGLCKKINKTLTQKQKVVSLVRLFEIINVDRKFSDQRMAILNTVAEVFNITNEEFKSVESFVIKNETHELDDGNILIINDKNEHYEYAKRIHTKHLDTNIFILRVKSVDLYFLRYTGNQELFLNGLPINNNRIYLFANGSTVKLPKSAPIYYSDVVSHFMADITSSKISFTARDVGFQFPNGNLGLRNIDFSEGHGRLIGIMGASGAGKTTLLNVLSGIDTPSAGSVQINGLDLHNDKSKLEGVIGLIPQDDLLIEELTVFQNLFFSAKLCFKDKSESEISELVNKTLHNLGLYDRKDLKVGSPLNKTISGGQRKRLNIALELVREPSILFVDEPTSGLSSRDSENVMDLLRELALKGKLIFVVIHQPSSDIYKMFDKMIILDTGGYQIFYGNPVEGVMYFKRMDAQINSDIGECPTCGNVNPELIFNIIEAHVVDEFGNYTTTRKVSPEKWEENYQNNFFHDEVEEVKENPPKSLNIPNWLTQLKIYSIRDFLSKIGNKQYVALNLLEAPVLGFILAFIIRFIEDPNSKIYIFRENENISIYIFMALIVALFLGFMVSAEEIFKDRKILKREKFLNLSKSSYLISKIIILFTISAIQSFLFVIIANNLLGLKGMNFAYWLALFSTASFANMLGLNISATFNSAVTIYILIPLLMIPMMILSGAMFSFDKLNRVVGRIDKVPLIAEFMPTKWSYEALMVKQFKDNEFNKQFYLLEKDESKADFKKVYLIPELQERLARVDKEIRNINQVDITKNDLEILHNEINNENKLADLVRKENIERQKTDKIPYPEPIKFENIEQLTPENFNPKVSRNTYTYLKDLDKYYTQVFQLANQRRQNIINYFIENNPEKYKEYRDRYHNESIADIVKKVYEKNKIVEFKGRLVQHIDPIYMDPIPTGPLGIRTHFLAPRKPFLGHYFDTFGFNMVAIWVLTIILYICLYFDVFKHLLSLGEKLTKK